MKITSHLALAGAFFLAVPILFAEPEASCPVRCLRFQIRDCSPPQGKFMWYSLVENASSEDQSIKLEMALRDSSGKALREFRSHSFLLRGGERQLIRSRRAISLEPGKAERWTSSEVSVEGCPHERTHWPHSPEGDIIDFSLE